MFCWLKEKDWASVAVRKTGKTLRKHHVKNREAWRNWASPPMKTFKKKLNKSVAGMCLRLYAAWKQKEMMTSWDAFQLYFLFLWPLIVQGLLLRCLGKGNVFPFTESVRGILQSKGCGRHNWHSLASLTAARPMIAKALHHVPVFQQLQPHGRLPPLGSGGIAFLDTAPKQRSGRFHWGPGMQLQLRNPHLQAGEVFWTILFEVNQVGLSIRVELLLYQYDWAFPPLAACFVLFIPDLCIIHCLPKLPYLQLLRLWQIWVWFCHNQRAATKCPFKLFTLETEALKSWKRKAWQKSRARQWASPLFLICTSVSPPNLVTPKNEGGNKPRCWLPLWPFCPAITWLLLVDRKLSIYYFLWQIRRVGRSNSSCYGKTDGGGKK